MRITKRQLKNLIREHVDESPLTVEFLEWNNEWDQSSWTLEVNGDEDGHWLTGRPDANYLADMIVGGWAREQDPPLDDRSQEYDDIVDDVEGQLTQQPAFNQALKDAIRAHENYEEQERGLYEHMQESKGLSKKIHHRGRRMKITRRHLRRLIAEETRRLNEQGAGTCFSMIELIMHPSEFANLEPAQDDPCYIEWKDHYISMGGEINDPEDESTIADVK